jgi:Bacteriophage HK97-gp10, putative tail-component
MAAAAPVDVRITWQPNMAGFREIGFLPGMRSFTAGVATKYARLAAQLTPANTGRTRRAIRVQVSGQDRESAYTAVKASWSFWHFVEFGSIHNRPAAPFRNAAAQMGMRFEDPGRGS